MHQKYGLTFAVWQCCGSTHLAPLLQPLAVSPWRQISLRLPQQRETAPREAKLIGDSLTFLSNLQLRIAAFIALIKHTY